MKKVLALLAIVLLMGAGCDKNQPDVPSDDPLPPKPKPTISAQAVMICTNVNTHVRQPDFWCGDPKTGKDAVDGHHWVYPYNTSNWAHLELPAVGETLRAGWGFPNPPAGMEASLPPRIPEEGAKFVR